MTIRPEPTLDDIKRLAQQLGVTFTTNRDAFDLDKSTPLEIHGTYRANQAGINASFSVLVHLQESERRLRIYQQDSQRALAQLRQRTRRRRSIGTPGVLGLCFLAALSAYSIGTFYPQTRAITGPLTILCMALMVLSGCILLFNRTRN